MKKVSKYIIILSVILLIVVFFIFWVNKSQSKVSLQTSSTALSNKKIGWGIKREDNHKQPDLGSQNKKVIDEYQGIAMGNAEKPYVYLTFDEGYEAGYTEKMLAVLKENQDRKSACRERV